MLKTQRSWYLFPLRDYKYLGKKQTVKIHLPEERQLAQEIVYSVGSYEVVQVHEAKC